MAARAWPAVGLLVVLMACLPAGVAAGATAPLDSACEQAYGGLPDDDVVPDWLKTSVPVKDLATSRRYDLLAGKLLYTGIIDGSTCPSYGLNPDGSPNGCGIELSQNAVAVWQNQFDPWIAAQSAQNGVPERVVKAVIAVELQFWPGSDWGKGEIGLGQMTEFGADLALTWQADRYRQVCGQVFDPVTCGQSYQYLEYFQQAALRGSLIRGIDATCSSCKGGIDLAKGEQQIQVLVEALNASCRQTGYLFRRATGNSPSISLSYEDFWKAVLADYHAGSGCLLQAIQSAGSRKSWLAIAAAFPRGCLSGAEYIRRIEEQIAS